MTSRCGAETGERRRLGPCVPGFGSLLRGERVPRRAAVSGRQVVFVLRPASRLASKPRIPRSLPSSRAACHRLFLPPEDSASTQRIAGIAPRLPAADGLARSKPPSTRRVDGGRQGTPKGSAHRAGDDRGKARSPRPPGPRPARQSDPGIY